jgi:hypothetical protein
MATLLSVPHHRASFGISEGFSFFQDQDEEDEVVFRPKSFSGPTPSRVVDGASIEQLADNRDQSSFFLTIPSLGSAKGSSESLEASSSINRGILRSKFTNYHRQPPAKRQRPARLQAGKADTESNDKSPSSESTISQAVAKLPVPPKLRPCAVCSEEFPEIEIAVRAAGGCNHRTKTCGDCSSSWIASQIETVGWEHVRCPECPRLLSYDDIKSAASKDVFLR